MDTKEREVEDVCLVCSQLGQMVEDCRECLFNIIKECQITTQQ